MEDKSKDSRITKEVKSSNANNEPTENRNKAQEVLTNNNDEENTKREPKATPKPSRRNRMVKAKPNLGDIGRTRKRLKQT